jgi:hypothetical protein
VAVVAGLAPIGIDFVNYTRTQGLTAAFKHTTAIMTGFSEDNRWHPENMKYGLMPLLAGFMAHWVAGKVGLNRAIAKAGIPFVRI